LHVLGMPPAFVLSQDQTLRLTSNANPNASPKANVKTNILRSGIPS
jgi:hypothetical protein